MQPLPKRGSGLEYHYSVVQRTVLVHQDPVTGLLPAHQIEGCENHAWIRDNVYSISAVWALALAYRRQPEKDGQVTSIFKKIIPLKGLFTFFVFLDTSHILNSNGVWYN